MNKLITLLAFTLLLTLPIKSYSGEGFSGSIEIPNTDISETELLAYYDLRNRKSYVQVTNINANINVCIHVQVFQQDRGCSELDFEDELTPGDTVVYDMENLVRNNGTIVPVNLNDNSYGYVAITAYDCITGQRIIDENNLNPIIGNFRIIDDSGYEYRTNLAAETGRSLVLLENNVEIIRRDVLIHFNTVNGSDSADVVGFLYEDLESAPIIRNIPEGITFSVFQFDENEEPLSCDQVTFACGENKVMNYGINEDYPASRGENLLCSGGGLVEEQTHGFIRLENATTPSLGIIESTETEFACFVGLNNGNGTGSMDSCFIGPNIIPAPPP